MQKRYFVILVLLLGSWLLPTSGKSQYFLSWDFYDLETDVRESGANPDLVVDGNGTLHASFWDQERDKLVYCQRPVGGNWSFEYVDNTGRNGFKSSIAIGPGNTAYIAYHEDINGSFQIRLAQRIGASNWNIEQISDSVAQFGLGWGEYGNWSDANRTEYIQPSLDLEFDNQGDPRIAFFASWYNLNSMASCGEYYSAYEFQPYFAWKSNGTWVVKQVGDYQDKTASCGGSPAPWGDRYGEWLKILIDQNGDESIVTNSYFNREIIRLLPSASYSTWNTFVVDSQPNVFLWPSFLELYTLESPSAHIDKQGNLHVAFTTSYVYGQNFEDYLPLYYFRVYVRIDSGGNMYQHILEPQTNFYKPYRENTQIYAPSADSVFMTYFEGDGAGVIFSYSLDSGQTWSFDTISSLLTTQATPFVRFGDSLFSLTYETDRDRLLFGKKAISDPNWTVAEITTSEERAEFFDSEIFADASDTTIMMVYNDRFGENLFYNEGSITTNNWIGGETLIGQGENKYYDVSLASTSNGIPVAAYAGGSMPYPKLALNPGSGWQYEVIDSTAMSHYIDVAISANDMIHVAYNDLDSNWLWHASRAVSGGAWTVELIDSSTFPAPEYLDIKIDNQNVPHVIYYKPEDRSINYSVRTGPGSWLREVVHADSNLVLGRNASLAFGPNGNPMIAYPDEIKFQLFFAERIGPGNWAEEILDSSGTTQAADPTSLVVDKFGNPWIAYNYDDGFGRIKLQKRDSTVWSTISVSTTGRMADAFKLHTLNSDLYIPGKKNVIGATGIGLLHSRNGLFVSVEESVETISKENIKVFPNPSQGLFQFEIDSKVNQVIDLQIVDILGRVRLEPVNREMVNPGKNTFSVDMSPLEAGIYFYRLQTDRGILSGRMVLMK